MVILIAGASHTGKTLLAQTLLERFHYPYLSLDHLKMGLIRSNYTSLTPEDDLALTNYLWPIVRAFITTVLENNQNLIVEGCYLPFTWRQDFSLEQQMQIRYCCLIMSSDYLDQHQSDLLQYANMIEHRVDTSLSFDILHKENQENLRQCRVHGLPYFFIDHSYPDSWDFLGDFILNQSCQDAPFLGES